MNLEDTIVAVSTPAGRAILRLSGPRAMAIADEVFHPASPVRLAHQPTYTAHEGRLGVAGLSVKATVYLMRAPRSYTREDTVEFHIGAWPALVPDLVAGLVAGGARPAEPGEFTFRALTNGRLDLAQAEAVMAVIGAADRMTLRAAADLLGGHLSREIERLADEVRRVLALVEAGLDFSDQDIEIIPPGEIAAALSAAGAALADLGRRSRGLETFSGRVRLVVAGRPNAGKSSLFNRLLAADRAIVSPEAGTTRDELRSTLHIGGLEFVLSDTAGIEATQQQGVAMPPFPDPEDIAAKAKEKALAAIGAADLVLVLIDATAPSFEGTEEILALAAAPILVAITKCDLALPDRAREYLTRSGATAESIATSAVTGEGMSALGRALVGAVVGGTVDRQAAGPVVTARHRAAMEQAASALARAAHLAHALSGGAGTDPMAGPKGSDVKGIDPVGGAELVAVELHEALDALGAILGRQVDADVLGTIFARFCIGK